MKKNHLLCIDLAINLQHDFLLDPNKKYLGWIRCKLPSEGNIHGDQYEFKEVEVPLKVCRQSMHLFVGKYVTLTCRPDGSLHLNLRNIDLNGIDIDTFCLELMNEVRLALRGLVEEG